MSMYMYICVPVRYKLNFKLSDAQIRAAREESLADEAAFNRTWFRRYLNLFPRNTQVVVGTTTCLLASVIIYNIIRPGEREPMKTLSPEWQKATEQYEAVQNNNPITRYGELKEGK